MSRAPFLDDGDVVVYAGDCIEVMRQLPEASIDAIITDPPYGLEFMGKDWDAPWRETARWRSASRLPGSHSKNPTPRPQGWAQAGTPFQEFSESWAREAFRVLKPGAHLLAFGGTRTYHRLAAGIEDAGFEIRDCLAWLYGSGFPKSLDVSKAIDKAAGAEREVVGTITRTASLGRGATVHQEGGDKDGTSVITTAATVEARKWDGWGTALKPAFEPIVLARKPLTGTVAQNVLAHGTGALNINATRIGNEERVAAYTSLAPAHGNKLGAPGTAEARRGTQGDPKTYVGRWPANVALDETAAELLDQQAPNTGGGGFCGGGIGEGLVYGTPGSGQTRITGRVDANGGASRFFYTAKASRADRNTSGANNTHPTVKPTDLMRWLVRLVTPPGGIVLDPFGGSGSTAVACRAEGFRCILVEREDEYLGIIKDRLGQLSLLAELDS